MRRVIPELSEIYRQLRLKFDQDITVINNEHTHNRHCQTEINEREELVSLDLRERGIPSLPSNIFADTPYIQYINLSYNELTTLDQEDIALLPSLKGLDLSGNPLQVLDGISPPELYVSKTRITKLSVPHSEILEASQCKLEYVDMNDEIREVKLHGNDLKNLHELGKSLTNFDISDNPIDLPEDHFNRCMNIKSLNLSDTDTLVSSSLFSRFKFIQQAFLSNCKINQIEHFFDNSTHLHTLDLSNNNLTSFKEDLSHTQLKTLNLAYNNMSVISKIEKISTLESLNLASNDLTSIPQLPGSLKALNLSSNRITKIPQMKNPNLVSLNLNSNDLKKIEKLSFPNLQSLDISSNQIRYLKTNWTDLDSLSSLDLTNNPMEFKPHHFIGLINLKFYQDFKESIRLTDLINSFRPLKEQGIDLLHLVFDMGVHTLTEENGSLDAFFIKQDCRDVIWVNMKIDGIAMIDFARIGDLNYNLQRLSITKQKLKSLLN